MDKLKRINTSWKTVNVDDREILTKPYIVESLAEALEISKLIIPIIEKRGQSEQTQLSLTAKDVMVVLNGHTDEPISRIIQNLASKIDNVVKKYYQSN